ncbi:hypothetical protein PAPYR_12893 [Paratrimastix pyriformis]|uniref:Nucleotidyltransferase family protein n=1 Tax=Paratrimastix pyriformis TaxID=342808 RepID=A0ABQ8U157_9EUKA|nr:hypothetical protein PAPYR_12893 [Paratrimastix pyriformis]
MLFEEGKAILQTLPESLSYLVIGSFGLQLVLPAALAGRPPADIDLLLPDDPEVVGRLVQFMAEQGFSCQSWSDVVTAQTPTSVYVGRNYVRFVRGPILIDATYHNPYYSFAEAWQLRQEVDRIHVASPRHTAHLMKVRGLPKDMERVRLVARLTNDPQLLDIPTLGSDSGKK